MALLGWLLATPVQAAQPSHITIGAIGSLGDAPLLTKAFAPGRPELILVAVADRTTLQGLDLVVVPDRASSSWTPAQRDLVRAAFAAGLPLVVQGPGEALRKLCGVSSTVHPNDLGAIQVYGCRLRPDGTASGYYLLQDANPPVPETSIVRGPALDGAAPAMSGPAPDGIMLGAPWSPLDGVLDWLDPSREPLKRASAWESAWDVRWQDASVPDKFISTWDFWVSKLVDNKTGRDFYAVDIKPHTEIRSYVASYSSQVGWYLENRTSALHHDLNDVPGLRKSTLVEYQPTGTQSGGTVGWTIGGSLSADIGLDPSGGGSLTAEYSRTMNLLDVTMLDQSSLYDAESKWHESYSGPNYEWWPVSMSQPCANARTTHYSQLAAIVSVSSDPVLVAPPLAGIRSSVNVSNRIGRDYGWHWVNVIYVEWYHQAYVPTRTGVIDVNYNRAPMITEYNPSNDVVNTEPHLPVNFDATAYDADGTEPSFEWYLDDVYQATGSAWTYDPTMADVGAHLVRVVATDGAATDDQIWTVAVSTTIGVDDPPVRIPASVVLSQNSPNPFNPQTRIAFGVPRACLVRIDVYDATGAHVRTLIDREMAAGMSAVDWNGRDDRGSAVSTGSYFIKMEADGRSLTRKAVLAR